MNIEENNSISLTKDEAAYMARVNEPLDINERMDTPKETRIARRLEDRGLIEWIDSPFDGDDSIFAKFTDLGLTAYTRFFERAMLP